MTQRPLDYQTSSTSRRKVGPLVFGFVPLVVYPFCLLSNVMSLAGAPGRGNPGVLLRCASNGFLWGSTPYPVVWLVAALDEPRVAFRRTADRSRSRLVGTTDLPVGRRAVFRGLGGGVRMRRVRGYCSSAFSTSIARPQQSAMARASATSGGSGGWGKFHVDWMARCICDLPAWP